MNKIFNVLFTGMLALGIMTANAESQIFKKKKKKNSKTEAVDKAKQHFDRANRLCQERQCSKLQEVIERSQNY